MCVCVCVCSVTFYYFVHAHLLTTRMIFPFSWFFLGGVILSFHYVNVCATFALLRSANYHTQRSPPPHPYPAMLRPSHSTRIYPGGLSIGYQAQLCNFFNSVITIDFNFKFTKILYWFKSYGR